MPRTSSQLPPGSLYAPGLAKAETASDNTAAASVLFDMIFPSRKGDARDLAHQCYFSSERMELQTFGRYQLIKRIAVGGMGEVFLARQKGPVGFQKMVVVK